MLLLSWLWMMSLCHFRTTVSAFSMQSWPRVWFHLGMAAVLGFFQGKTGLVSDALLAA